MPEGKLTDSGPFDSRSRVFLFVLFALVLCFGKPLFDLAQYAFRTELYSHVLLIPFVSAYLVWMRKSELVQNGAQAPRLGPPLTRWAAVPFAVGVCLLAVYWIGRANGWPMKHNDRLSFSVLPFICFVFAACLAFLTAKALRALVFPLIFLVFMVPFPTVVENGIEIFFQHTSAEAAYGLLNLAGMPILRDGLAFQLPGCRIVVAQECSGVRSSLVLFITSLIAGHLLLQTPWKRAFLVAAVIPLGILRNGVRIFTIAQLCVHVGPEMIDSPIHTRGGPLFFLLSLIPFFLLLFWLRKSEAKLGSRTDGREST